MCYGCIYIMDHISNGDNTIPSKNISLCDVTVNHHYSTNCIEFLPTKGIRKVHFVTGIFGPKYVPFSTNFQQLIAMKKSEKSKKSVTGIRNFVC